MDCPSEDRLNTYLAGQLEPWEAETIAQHVASCESCPALIDALGSVDERGAHAACGDRTEAHPLAPGDKVAHYVLLHRVGAGGMGVVWAAYDPVFDRELAIKLLGSHAQTSRALRARFEREARITAKLQHPAIVHIQDSGVYGDGEPFYVMKLVLGKSLDTAIAEHAGVTGRLGLVSNVTAIVDAIAYAHDQGVLHRDLKPQNVIVGEFGETVVIDWGLATTTRGTAAASAPDAMGLAAGSASAAGSVLGTPAYMPPEQASGAIVDHRADVYALGAILYHVVAGQRPFAGHTPAATLAAVIDGPPEPLATLAPDAPPDLRTIVDKAMARAPKDRYQSAKQLAEELKRFLTGQMVGSHRYSRRELARRWLRRHRTVLTAAGGIVLAGVAIAGLTRDTTVADTRCEGAGMDHPIAGVWNQARAAAVRTSFVATKLPHAAATADRVVRRLDDYSRGLTAARVTACEATHRRGEQSDALLDLRMQCLERKLASLDALATLLERDVSPEMVDRAIQSTAQLAPVTDCDDSAALLAAFPPPHGFTRKLAVQAVQLRLDRAIALESLGRYREAAVAIEALGPAAAQLAHPPLDAAVHYHGARAQRQATRLPRAEAAARLAINAASLAKDDELVARAWFELLYSLVMQGKAEEVVKLDGFAAAAVARAGDTRELQSRLLHVRGTSAFKQLDLKNARALYERSLALADRADPKQWPTVMNLGMLSQREGKFADAKQIFDGLLVRLERDLGPDHPETARIVYHLCLANESLGELTAARALCERALAVRERSLGADDPRTAESLELLGFVMSRQADPRAEDHLRRALAIKERALGPDHAEVARMLANIAEVLQHDGKLEAATEMLRRSLAIKIKTHGRNHPLTAYALHGLGVVLADGGDHAAGRAHLQEAYDIFSAAHGADHPTIAHVLVGLSRCDAMLGRHQAAIDEAERALAIRRKATTDPVAIAEASFVLGNSLWLARRTRDRATELVRTARALYAAAGPGAARELADVDAWLASR